MFSLAMSQHLHRTALMLLFLDEQNKKTPYCQIDGAHTTPAGVTGCLPLVDFHFKMTCGVLRGQSHWRNLGSFIAFLVPFLSSTLVVEVGLNLKS